ncbi:hypothetical protein GQ42DRAFT_104062, partial [Ramicandelaber brevisporus]
PRAAKRPDHVGRPPNAFFLYRADHSRMIQGALVASGQKPTNQSNISKRLGDAWKNETDEVRAIYEERARHIREQHARDHPGFQY